MSDFPNRPDHPDFWDLCMAVQENDNFAENNPSDVMLAHASADPDSMMYVAMQRALRAWPFAQRLPLPMQAAMAAMWVDGFEASTAFHKHRQAAKEKASNG